MSTLPKLIVILGPTASGKTGLSLKLAKKFKGEIVNADSRQIYRFMDIGTGKVAVEAEGRRKLRRKTSIVFEGVRHYLIDVVNPDEEFTVADYKKMAVAAIQNVLKRGKTPFLVGGTGLYIQSVVDNLEIPAVPPNKKLRAQFEKELKKYKIENLKSKILDKWYKKLLKLDPGAKDAVDKNNPRRIIRAIEVCLATHQPFSKLREKGEPLFDVLQLGVSVARSALYKRIDQRVDEMIKQGLVAETERLIKKFSAEGGSASGGQVTSSKFQDLPSMSGIGYKEIGEYLKQESRIKNQELRKKLLMDEVQKIKYRTHAYARRQMTWFRKDKRIKWVKSYKECEQEIVKWLNC